MNYYILVLMRLCKRICRWNLENRGTTNSIEDPQINPIVTISKDVNVYSVDKGRIEFIFLVSISVNQSLGILRYMKMGVWLIVDQSMRDWIELNLVPKFSIYVARVNRDIQALFHHLGSYNIIKIYFWLDLVASSLESI